VAGFSSRGPSLSSGGGLLKPDVMAPGVDVVAAVSPAKGDNNYNIESGTSMASPHIAGVAALIISKHQDWSPMAVKSAIMTTASALTNKGNPIKNGSVNATPFDMGSGEVNPAGAFTPGLVYDSGRPDWIRYLCNIAPDDPNLAKECPVYGSIKPSQLNQPNIAVGDVTGAVTVTRTVTNVDPYRSYYNAEVKAPAGFKVKVVPNHLELNPGESKTFSVTITRTNAAPLEQYAFGSLTWVNPYAPRTVRSVIAVNPVALAAPGEVTGSGVSGAKAIAVTSGYAGTLTATAAGLVAGTPHSASLVTGPFTSTAPVADGDTLSFEVTVPDTAVVGRFATFDSDYAAGTDIDLFAYPKLANGSLDVANVALSAGGTAEESVDVGPGTYVVFVNLYANPAGATSPLTVKGYDFQVGSSAVGNLTVTPASQSVTSAGTATVTASWSGLTAGSHYLGAVLFGNGTAVIGGTLISVNA
jgi:hypothetical protein